MSKDSHTKAYITGFILSLVFTLLPYWLVVTHTVKGNWLLGAILAIGLLQMLVQIVFFLHLGRNPELRWQLGFFVATFGAVLVVVVGSVVIMAHLHRNMTPKDITDKISNDEGVHEVGGAQVGTCPGNTGTIRMVELNNSAANPAHTDAKLCDTLIIYNGGGAARDVEFGAAGKPETYAGELGSTIRPGQNTVITLTVPGTFKFHALDNISGDFTVAP